MFINYFSYRFTVRRKAHVNKLYTSVPIENINTNRFRRSVVRSKRRATHRRQTASNQTLN